MANTRLKVGDVVKLKTGSFSRYEVFNILNPKGMPVSDPLFFFKRLGRANWLNSDQHTYTLLESDIPEFFDRISTEPTHK